MMVVGSAMALRDICKFIKNPACHIQSHPKNRCTAAFLTGMDAWLVIMWFFIACQVIMFAATMVGRNIDRSIEKMGKKDT